MIKNLTLLYVSVFLTIVGFGMVFPLLPFYAQEFGASSTGIGVLAAAYPIGQLLVAPLVGQLSDKIGRKWVLTMSLAGSAFAFFLFGSAGSLVILIFSRALHGIFTAGSFPVATAYVGDVTERGERVVYMSRLSAIFALGIIIGPAFSGLLSGVSNTLPFYIAAVVCLITAGFVYLFLPESLPVEKRSKEVISISSVLDNFKRVAKGVRGEYNVLFFGTFAWAFAISNFQVAFPLFTQEKFGFSSTDIGFVFSFVGVVSAFVQFVILPRLVKRFAEYKTLIIATIMSGVGQMLIPFSPELAVLFSFVALGVFGSSMVRPTINTILSNESDIGQGTIMGMAASFTSFGRIVGPVVAGVIIAYINLSIQFIVTALVFFLAALFLVRRYTDFAFKKYLRHREHLKDKQTPIG